MITKLRLWLVRHGQTDWNTTGLCLGKTDIPMNITGIEAVRNLKKNLDISLCDVVYCSPSTRALVTARILTETATIPIIIEPKLREIDFGHWEGKTWCEITTLRGNEWDTWRQDPTYSNPYKGESLEGVFKRVSLLYTELQQKHEGQTILLVGHGGSLNVLLCMLFRVPLSTLWTFQLNPASFSEIIITQQGLMLTSLNYIPMGQSSKNFITQYMRSERVEPILQVI